MLCFEQSVLNLCGCNPAVSRSDHYSTLWQTCKSSGRLEVSLTVPPRKCVHLALSLLFHARLMMSNEFELEDNGRSRIASESLIICVN